MNVNLYHNKSLANVVNKTIGTATVVTGTAFVLPFDERFPKIRFTSSTDWDDFNYAQIDGKYYYITGVEHVMALHFPSSSQRGRKGGSSSLGYTASKPWPERMKAENS